MNRPVKRSRYRRTVGSDTARDRAGSAAFQTLAVIVREHCPEPQQGRCRDANAELRHVPLEKCLDKLTAPRKAVDSRAREKGLGKAAALPVACQLSGAHLGEIES